jgi:hypothetical protein
VFTAALVVAYAALLQPPGCNQTAHYALVQSLAHGTLRIDRYHDETCDTAYVGGHYYAAKAPGLALFTEPWFELLRALHVVPHDRAVDAGYPVAMGAMPRRALWQVGLWGSVVPALVLVLLLRRVADELVPGRGLAAAGAVGAGTLVLPFATLFFAHALATCLGFGAFALLYLRDRRFLAGVAAGFAVCVDFPLALVAAALAVYLWRRAAPFVAGAALGVVPLLVFDSLAFGNPFRLAYANAVLKPGRSGHAVLGANSSGFFGVGVPRLHAAAELLFSPRGLFMLSPVLLAALAGLFLIRRREALLAAALFAIFVIYNSGYYLPFGGYVPGPRFLIGMLPFLALGLPAAFARWPLATAALAVFSVGAMVVATAANPMLGDDDTHRWVARWQHGDFVTSIFVHGHGWSAATPFLVAVAVTVACAATQVPTPRFAPVEVAAVVGWAVVFVAAPDLLRVVDRDAGLLALIVVVAAMLAVLWRARPLQLLAGLPLVVLLVPGFAAHATWSLLVAVLALVLALAARQLVARRASPA